LAEEETVATPLKRRAVKVYKSKDIIDDSDVEQGKHFI